MGDVRLGLDEVGLEDGGNFGLGLEEVGSVELQLLSFFYLGFYRACALSARLLR